MFILFYILCGIFGVLLGILIAKNTQPKCKHNWRLIESGNINNRNRYGEKIQIGFLKVYECDHCKKLKKEQIEID